MAKKSKPGDGVRGKGVKGGRGMYDPSEDMHSFMSALKSLRQRKR
ncbi:lariocidin/triculamin family lasso peptide core domain [Actinosynnema sp. CS-041913]